MPKISIKYKCTNYQKVLKGNTKRPLMNELNYYAEQKLQ